MLVLNSRPLATLGITFATLSLFFLWHQEPFSGNCKVSLDQHHFSTDTDDSGTSNFQPQKRRNIAFATEFPFHHDVMLALAWTFQRVMGKDGQISLYAPSPLSWDFQDVMNDLGLYHGTIKNRDDLLKDINDNGSDGGIDMVVFGTCEIDMRRWHKDLLAAWDARNAAHKFQLVCMVHNQADMPWQESIPDWSRRNAIRVLTISEHVEKSFRTAFQKRAESDDSVINSCGYEDIPIDVHVQILNLPKLPDLSPTRSLSNVAIQGTFSTDRRDYFRIFDDLRGALHENPKLWGYLPLGDGPTFIPDNDTTNSPFQLHLVGSGWIQIPPELKEVVKIHTGRNYAEFYDLMASMDVCMPAFSSRGASYFTQQASATVGMCLEVNVPMLVTQRIRQTYTYIDDERVTITRPAVMSEVQAIQALRSGNASAFLAADPSESGIAVGLHPRSRLSIEHMMQRGWIRPKKGFNTVKERIWGQNYVVAWRLLRDLGDGQAGHPPRVALVSP